MLAMITAVFLPQTCIYDLTILYSSLHCSPTNRTTLVSRVCAYSTRCASLQYFHSFFRMSSLPPAVCCCVCHQNENTNWTIFPFQSHQSTDVGKADPLRELQHPNGSVDETEVGNVLLDSLVQDVLDTSRYLVIGAGWLTAFLCAAS